MNQNLRETKTHGTTEYPFALYHMRKFISPFAVSLHWHDEVELVYVEKGQLALTIGKKDYDCTAGDIFVINSQEIHKMSVENLDTSYYTILFPMSSLLFQATDNVNRNFLFPLARRELLFSSQLAGAAAHNRLKGILDDLIEAHYNGGKSRLLYIRLLLLSLICLFADEGALLPAPKPPRHSLLNREILSYVGEHYSEEFSLEEIADRFHMAPKYFSRYFKNTFHTTLTDYINHLRLEKAVELLHSTALSVTEIALQSGYSSCSYFNRKFKEAFGQSPNAYRHAGRGDATDYNTGHATV